MDLVTDALRAHPKARSSEGLIYVRAAQSRSSSVDSRRSSPANEKVVNIAALDYVTALTGRNDSTTVYFRLR